MNSRMPLPSLMAKQLFAKVIVPWFIRPMSCVLAATAGRLLTAPGCPSKEQSKSQRHGQQNASTTQLSIHNKDE